MESLVFDLQGFLDQLIVLMAFIWVRSLSLNTLLYASLLASRYLGIYLHVQLSCCLIEHNSSQVLFCPNFTLNSLNTSLSKSWLPSLILTSLVTCRQFPFCSGISAWYLHPSRIVCLQWNYEMNTRNSGKKSQGSLINTFLLFGLLFSFLSSVKDVFLNWSGFSTSILYGSCPSLLFQGKLLFQLSPRGFQGSESRGVLFEFLRDLNPRGWLRVYWMLVWSWERVLTEFRVGYFPWWISALGSDSVGWGISAIILLTLVLGRVEEESYNLAPIRYHLMICSLLFIIIGQLPTRTPFNLIESLSNLQPGELQELKIYQYE